MLAAYVTVDILLLLVLNVVTLAAAVVTFHLPLLLRFLPFLRYLQEC